jgi:hypothetical protein
MRTALRIAAWLLIIAVVAYLGVLTWYATFWPVRLEVLVPLYKIGFLICLPAIIYLWMSNYKGPPRS